MQFYPYRCKYYVNSAYKVEIYFQGKFVIIDFAQLLRQSYTCIL